jgi:hypothetical protein
LLGISGASLFFAFEEDVFKNILGFNKSQWLDFHMITAIVTVLLVSYHIGSKWAWIEKYILDYDKNPATKTIKIKQLSNFSFLVVFILSLSTGFLSWIMSGECPICLDIHQILGLFMWLAFLFHIFIHWKFFKNS